MATATQRLGQLLVNRGLLSGWQLDAALKEQRSTKEFLGFILIRKGWLTEEALLRTLGDQMGVPYVRLAEQQVDWTVSKRFSPALLAEHHCFPINMDGASVTVAIANPLDVWAVSELEKEAGFRKVRLVLSSVQEIAAATRRAHQQAIQSLDTRPTREERDHDAG